MTLTPTMLIDLASIKRITWNNLDSNKKKRDTEMWHIQLSFFGIIFFAGKDISGFSWLNEIIGLLRDLPNTLSLKIIFFNSLIMLIIFRFA